MSVRMRSMRMREWHGRGAAVIVLTREGDTFLPSAKGGKLVSIRLRLKKLSLWTMSGCVASQAAVRTPTPAKRRPPRGKTRYNRLSLGVKDLSCDSRNLHTDNRTYEIGNDTGMNRKLSPRVACPSLLWTVCNLTSGRTWGYWETVMRVVMVLAGVQKKKKRRGKGKNMKNKDDTPLYIRSLPGRWGNKIHYYTRHGWNRKWWTVCTCCP